MCELHEISKGGWEGLKHAIPSDARAQNVRSPEAAPIFYLSCLFPGSWLEGGPMSLFPAEAEAMSFDTVEQI